MIMNKKNLYICPSTQVVLVQLEAMIAASAKAEVDNQPTLDYDPTQGDASTGKSRKYDIWADPEEEEEELQ